VLPVVTRLMPGPTRGDSLRELLGALSDGAHFDSLDVFEGVSILFNFGEATRNAFCR
jgi:hypothetical protein